MKRKVARCEVIMAGLGGSGVLMAGELLARAVLSMYKHVLYLPSYVGFMRGGPCECTVIFSDNRIASPILPKTEAVIVIEPSQLKPFEGRVKSGGMMVIESSGLRERVGREDVTVLNVPALEVAIGMGSSQVANLVLLGAYVGATKVVPPHLIEAELEKRLGGRESALQLNKEAFRKGMSGKWQRAK